MASDSHFFGYDEAAALKYSQESAITIGEVPPTSSEDLEVWQINAGRIAHRIVRDKGAVDGFSLLERLALQEGVKRIVTQPNFFPALLESAQANQQ